MASDPASNTDRRDAKPAAQLSARLAIRLYATVCASLLCVTAFEVPGRAYVVSEKRVDVHGITFVLTEYNWNSKDGMVLQAWRKGKRVLEKHGHRFFLYRFDNEEQPLDIDSNTKIPTADFNGDGEQDIVIEEWSGGAHCCYTFEIYSLGGSLSPTQQRDQLHKANQYQLNRLWHHEAGHGHLKVFLNKRELPKLSVEDSTFAYWGPFGFADSPRPAVFLQWVKDRRRPQHGDYQIDRTKMRRSFDASKFAEVRKEATGADATRFFIEEIYKGNAIEAMQLWKGLPAKDRQYCFSGFLKQFKSSPFYYQLVRLNGSKAIAEMQRLAK